MKNLFQRTDYNIRSFFGLFMRALNFINLKKIIFIFSLLVGVSLVSGCSAHNFGKAKNSHSVSKWEDYFDGNDFLPVNENSENETNIKHKK